MIGDWIFDPILNQLCRDERTVQLEPKVCDLLAFLATQPGQVASRNTLFETLWPGVTIGEDTLARSISKLRKALDDDPKSPSFIETVPKRGYRLIAPVDQQAVTKLTSRSPSLFQRKWQTVLVGASLCLSVAALGVLFLGNLGASVSDEMIQAQDRYDRFTLHDNEAAILLFEQIEAQRPDNASAQAGIAKALVQRVVRWPETLGADQPGASNLREAVYAGLTTSTTATATLARAEDFARRATRVSPKNAETWQSLGLVLTAQQRYGPAENAYQTALGVDSGAWVAMIGLGEIKLLRNRGDEATAYLEQAYRAMKDDYEDTPRLVGDWLAPLGVMIAQRHRDMGRLEMARLWYETALQDFPLYPEAIEGIAALPVHNRNKTH